MMASHTVPATVWPRPGISCRKPGLLGRQDVRRHRDRLAFDAPFLRRRAEAERIAAGQSRIEHRQPAAVAEIVMAADDAHQPGRMIGHRLGKTKRRREPGIAAVQRQLPRAVRIHGHPAPREVMRNIAVLPALIQDAAVVQHGRVVVAVLVERQLPQRSSSPGPADTGWRPARGRPGRAAR